MGGEGVGNLLVHSNAVSPPFYSAGAEVPGFPHHGQPIPGPLLPLRTAPCALQWRLCSLQSGEMQEFVLLFKSIP